MYTITDLETYESTVITERHTARPAIAALVGADRIIDWATEAMIDDLAIAIAQSTGRYDALAARLNLAIA